MKYQAIADFDAASGADEEEREARMQTVVLPLPFDFEEQEPPEAIKQVRAQIEAERAKPMPDAQVIVALMLRRDALYTEWLTGKL